MATATSTATWAERIWLDLQPTPGRMSSALRITLASVLTLILLLVWQVPFASIGLYFVFLVGRDSPAVSVRSGIMSLITLVAAVAVEMGVVALSDNDPMARLISVAVVSFLAAAFVVASNVPALASTWGFIFCTLIALWERHAPSNALVTTSLWLLAATGIAVGCSVLVEYLFSSRNPAHQLQEERLMRYRALVAMYTLYAQGADPRTLHEAGIRVSRLAVAGQSGMQRLYNMIVERNLDFGSLPIGARVRIPMLAQLMDVSAAFAFQQPDASDPDVRQRCEQIASECRALLENAVPQHESYMPLKPESRMTLLDRVEGILHVITSMPNRPDAVRDRELVALPSSKVPLLIPGALRDKNTWAFGFKISLCATLCYILYFAVDWPGISTSVTTVLIAGLSTTGAVKQRFTFRLVGALIGGLILGIGCMVFLFPEMDSIASLTIIIALMAFSSAWIAGGRQFNYVGLQIIFSFYLVAFEDFHAPTQLAPARDRLIGILVALVVMWFVLDQLWPVRTVTAMRRSLASILRNEADLFRTELATPPRDVLIRQTDTLRDHIGKTMAAIRTMNDAVEYEFGVDRQRHMETAHEILRAALTAVALVWNELAVLHREEDADFLTDPNLVDMRRKLVEKMDSLAASVLEGASTGRSEIQNEASHVLVSAGSPALEHPRYGEYAQNTVARYRELQFLVNGLRSQA
jgi:multidrug resistance protein MdtO